MSIVDPAYVLKLLQIASILSGYSVPSTPPPQVIEVTSEEMHNLACPKPSSAEDCDSYAGLYLDGDTIWIDAEWANSKASQAQFTSEASYIVHELTHFLQNAHSWGGYGCPHIAAREFEAYRVQLKYIHQYEHLNARFTLPKICGIQH